MNSQRLTQSRKVIRTLKTTVLTKISLSPRTVRDARFTEGSADDTDVKPEHKPGSIARSEIDTHLPSIRSRRMRILLKDRKFTPLYPPTTSGLFHTSTKLLKPTFIAALFVVFGRQERHLVVAGAKHPGGLRPIEEAVGSELLVFAEAGGQADLGVAVLQLVVERLVNVT